MNYRKGTKDQRGRAADRARRKSKLLARYPSTDHPYSDDHADCVHCGKGLTYVTLEQDRIIPGGPYRMSNVQPSCRPCNVRRGDSPITPFK
jgi:hypothetical protein